MAEHKDWPPDAWNPILVEIGRIVFNWNTLEGTVTRPQRALFPNIVLGTSLSEKVRFVVVHASVMLALSVSWKGDSR